MKLKTDIEIKALAKESAGEPLPDKDLIAQWKCYVGGYEKGYSQAQSQAQKEISSLREEVNFLKASNAKLEEARISHLEVNEKLQKENEELKEDIDWLLKAYYPKGKSEKMTILEFHNQCETIRRKWFK